MRITYRPEGSTDVRTIRTVTTAADGTYALQAQPTFHSVLRASFTGNDAVASSRSAEATTKLQLSAPVVTLSSTLVYAGTSVAFSGEVLPGSARPQVKLQWLRPDGRVVDLTGPQTADAAGRFAFRRVFPNPGSFQLRVLGLESAQHHGSASRLTAVRVLAVPTG